MKASINYDKLMKNNPTEYGRIVNKAGQEITFYEHPLRGDEAPVIVVCHELQLAEHSDFYETDDMAAEDGEYQPSFIDGKLFIGEFQNEI